MLVHAGAARQVLDRDPVSARASLEAIEEIGGRTMTDLDRLLGELRAAEDRVDEHASAVRGLGLDVEVRRDGRVPDHLLPVTGRIVQEALTNVVRHADARSAVVEVVAVADGVVVAVSDDGVGGPVVPGHGLRGMAGRVGEVGGSLEVTAAPGGGTRLEAAADVGPPMITVLLVDDDPLLRMGLRTLLSATDDVEVVGEASTGREAVALAHERSPDVVVMDVRMPDVDGIEATRIISGSDLAARVLVLTTFEHDENVSAALRAGASGFLLKRVAPERLLDAVRTVAAGDAMLDPAVTSGVIAEAVRSSPPRRVPALDDLTDREAEVLRLVARGLSNAGIAEVLTVEVSTVKTHVHHVLTKLELRDRVAAVVLAHDAGVVERPPSSR